MHFIWCNTNCTFWLRMSFFTDINNVIAFCRFFFYKSCVTVTSGQVASIETNPFLRAKFLYFRRNTMCGKNNRTFSTLDSISKRFSPSNVIIPSCSNASVTCLLWTIIPNIYIGRGREVSNAAFRAMIIASTTP